MANAASVVRIGTSKLADSAGVERIGAAGEWRFSGLIRHLASQAVHGGSP
jgi:hypothetical protein